MSLTVSPTEAKALLLSGQAPANMTVTGQLNLSQTPITHLPDHLTVQESLILTDCTQLTALPPHLTVATRIIATGCTRLTTIHPHISAYEINLSGTPIITLPTTCQARYKIDLTNCHALTHLPDDLTTYVLTLTNCHHLAALPTGLRINYLNITNCRQLTQWPLIAQVTIGSFVARNCDQLTQIPPWINGLAHVDLRGCTNLTNLPDNFRVTGWLDIGNTNITHLPASCQNVQLHWNGVPVTRRIAFHPETITIDEILNESNVERRRVLIERVGLEQFISQANAQILHEDSDPGGQRRLLKVPIPDDEDLVAISVLCPSTARHYLIRVPPTMQTCRQAAAWIAGFDDPDLYHPLIET